MENFIVSARKYRPQTFDTVVGQASITNTLRNAIRNNHLAQAFLFCGPRGVGKTTCARILAKTINCENLSESLEACNLCESCTSFNNNASFNIHELDAASNNSVDDIRNLVDQVRIPPQVGKYKVYIIDEVHMLSQAAFNAFLKTLEEPPAYAKFILATTEKHKIIPTILSRCQIYDFKRITIEDIAGHLAYVASQENVEAEQEGLHVIAQKSDGALRDALSIFDQIISFSGKSITYKNVIENLNVLDYDYYFKILEAILAGNISDTLIIINEILDNGFDGQHFLIGLGEHLRNLLVCKDHVTLQLLEVGGRIKEQYKQMSEKCSMGFLLKALDISNKCDIEYKNSNHKKLHLELALMQMCTIGTDAYQLPPKPAMASEKKQVKPYVKQQSQATSTINAPLIKKEEKITLKKTRNSAYGTVSIKNHQPKNKPEVENEEDNRNKPADEFSQSDLEQAWKKVSGNFQKDNNFFLTLSRNKPVKRENNNFEFTVDNKIQKKEIEDSKLKIMPPIKEILNNFHLHLNIVVTEQKAQTRAYTPQDKFKKMAEKNPALKMMKDKLNLEIDF